MEDICCCWWWVSVEDCGKKLAFRGNACTHRPGRQVTLAAIAILLQSLILPRLGLREDPCGKTRIAATWNQGGSACQKIDGQYDDLEAGGDIRDTTAALCLFIHYRHVHR